MALLITPVAHSHVAVVQQTAIGGADRYSMLRAFSTQ